eukprot:TRINITY_DN15655_c0_g1_i1.p1 TRINITY_DN15655_c0_g1~~TRINITY_DN15655_c0_g1_i1.p1  ORF type:complete len:789 (+),score=158.82 TRINITY_DN15655_c0_g1_i1:77-2443(+)
MEHAAASLRIQTGGLAGQVAALCQTPEEGGSVSPSFRKRNRNSARFEDSIRPEGGTSPPPPTPFGVVGSSDMDQLTVSQSPTSHAPFGDTRRQSTVSRAASAMKKGLGSQRRCGVEVENKERDDEVRRIALHVAVSAVLGLLLTCLNYGLITPPPLEDRDAGCAGCPNPPGGMSTETGFFIFLQALVSALTLVTAVCSFRYHYRLWTGAHDDAAVEGRAPPSLWSLDGVARFAVPLLWEMLVVLPHPVVFYARRRAFVYIVVWMFMRLYTVARWIGLQTALYRHRFDVFSQSHLRGQFSELTVDWGGTLRCLLIRQPATFVCIFTGVCLLSCAVCVFFAERNGAGGDAPVYENLADSMWFMFITYTTIGYGDMYPGSNLGRLVTCIAGVIGVVVANMVAGVLANRLNPSPAEFEMLTWLDKRKRMARRQSTAGQLVALYWRDRRRAKQMMHPALPLKGTAWNLYRNVRTRNEEDAPLCLPGGWVDGDEVIAAVDIRRKNVVVFKGTVGVVDATAAGGRGVPVKWAGEDSVLRVRPGEEIANVRDEANFIKFVSHETRQAAKAARVARLQLAEITGDSTFDAEEANKLMQTSIEAYKANFKNLESQGKGIISLSSKLQEQSTSHRDQLADAARDRWLQSLFSQNAASERTERIVLLGEEDVSRELLMQRCNQILLNGQLRELHKLLRSRADVSTSDLASSLHLVHAKLDRSPVTRPSPPPPPKPQQQPEPPRQDRTPTPSPRSVPGYLRSTKASDHRQEATVKTQGSMRGMERHDSASGSFSGAATASD